MQSWDITTLEVEPRRPEVIASDEEGRAIVINLPAGEKLVEHQVYERAWLVVATGAVEIDDATGEAIGGGPGLLVAFDPNERRTVRATEDSRLLLLLSPWPGVGHPRRPAEL